MRDVGDGIFDLARIQWSSAPVGKARPFVELDAEPAVDEIGIANLFGLADRHRRDLGIEQRMRRRAGHLADNLEVLTTGMDDLEDILVPGQQIHQRRQIDVLGERIDRGGLVFIGDLNKAQDRPIGAFAHELGIDRDERGFRQAFAQLGKRARIGNERVYFHGVSP